MIAISMLIVIPLILSTIFISVNQDDLYIDKSNIHGVGIFTSKKLDKEVIVFKCINKDQSITDKGSKINHSYNPNTYVLEKNGEWFIVSNKKINKNEELTVNYNDTPSFIKKADKSWK